MKVISQEIFETVVIRVENYMRDYAKLLLEQDLTLNPSDVDTLKNGDPLIEGMELNYIWEEYWRYGGYEKHIFRMRSSEVFADDPMPIIAERNKMWKEREDKKKEKIEEEKRIQALEKEERERKEFERLYLKYKEEKFENI